MVSVGLHCLVFVCCSVVLQKSCFSILFIYFFLSVEFVVLGVELPVTCVVLFRGCFSSILVYVFCCR